MAFFKKLLDKAFSSNEPRPFEDPLQKSSPFAIPSRASSIRYHPNNNNTNSTKNEDNTNDDNTNNQQQYVGNNNTVFIQQGSRVLAMSIDPILKLAAVAVITHGNATDPIQEYLTKKSDSGNNNNNNDNDNTRKPQCDIAIFPLPDEDSSPSSSTSNSCQWVFADDPTFDPVNNSISFIQELQWVPGTGCLGVLVNRGAFMFIRVGFDTSEPAFIHINDRSRYYTNMTPLAHSSRITTSPTLFVGTAAGSVVCAKMNRDNVATLSSELCMLNRQSVKPFFDDHFAVSHIVHCHYDPDLLLVAYSTVHDVESERGKYCVGFVLWSLSRNKHTGSTNGGGGTPLAGFMAMPNPSSSSSSAKTNTNNNNFSHSSENLILAQTLAFNVHWYNDNPVSDSSSKNNNDSSKQTDVSHATITCLANDGRILCFKQDHILMNNSSSTVDPNFATKLRLFGPSQQIASSQIFPPDTKISPFIRCMSNVKPNRCFEPVHQQGGTSNPPYPCQVYFLEYLPSASAASPTTASLESTLYASTNGNGNRQQQLTNSYGNDDDSDDDEKDVAVAAGNDDQQQQKKKIELSPLQREVKKLLKQQQRDQNSLSSSNSKNNNEVYNRSVIIGIAVRISANGNIMYSLSNRLGSGFKQLLSTHTSDICCSVSRNDFENPIVSNRNSSFITSWQSERMPPPANKASWFGTVFTLSNDDTSTSRSDDSSPSSSSFKCADLYIDLQFDKKNSQISLKFPAPIERTLPDASCWSVLPKKTSSLLLLSGIISSHNDEEQNTKNKIPDDYSVKFVPNVNQTVLLGVGQAHDADKTTWHSASSSSLSITGDCRTKIRSAASSFVITGRRKAFSRGLELDKHSLQLTRWNAALDCTLGSSCNIQLPDDFDIQYFVLDDDQQQRSNNDQDEDLKEAQADAFFSSISALIVHDHSTSSRNSNNKSTDQNQNQNNNYDDDDDDNLEFESEDLNMKHSCTLILQGTSRNNNSGGGQQQKVLLAINIKWNIEDGKWIGANVADSKIISKSGSESNSSSEEKGISSIEDDVACFRVLSNNNEMIAFATVGGAIMVVTLQPTSSNENDEISHHRHSIRTLVPPNIITLKQNSNHPPILAISNRIIGELNSNSSGNNNNNKSSSSSSICVITSDLRVIAIDFRSGSILHTVQLFTAPPKQPQNSKDKIEFNPLQLCSTPGSLPIKIDVYENRLATIEFLLAPSSDGSNPSSPNDQQNNNNNNSASNSTNNRLVSVDLFPSSDIGKNQIFNRLVHTELHLSPGTPRKKTTQGQVKILSRYRHQQQEIRCPFELLLTVQKGFASSTATSTNNNNTTMIADDELVLSLLTPGLLSLRARTKIPLSDRMRLLLAADNNNANSSSYSATIIPQMILNQELHVLVTISPTRVPVVNTSGGVSTASNHNNNNSKQCVLPFFGLKSAEESYRVIFSLISNGNTTIMNDEQKFDSTRVLHPMYSLWDTCPLSSMPSVFLPDFVISRQSRATRNAVSRDVIGTLKEMNNSDKKEWNYYSQGLLCALPFEEEGGDSNNKKSDSEGKKPGFFGKLFGAATRIPVYSRVQNLTQFLHLHTHILQRNNNNKASSGGNINNISNNDSSFDAFIQNVASTTDDENARNRLLRRAGANDTNSTSSGRNDNNNNNPNNAIANTKNEMLEARQRLQERGEAIERVENKSRNMANAAATFEENCAKLAQQKKSFWSI